MSLSLLGPLMSEASLLVGKCLCNFESRDILRPQTFSFSLDLFIAWLLMKENPCLHLRSYSLIILSVFVAPIISWFTLIKLSDAPIHVSYTASWSFQYTANPGGVEPWTRPLCCTYCPFYGTIWRVSTKHSNPIHLLCTNVSVPGTSDLASSVV